MLINVEQPNIAKTENYPHNRNQHSGSGIFKSTQCRYKMQGDHVWECSTSQIQRNISRAYSYIKLN